MNLETFINNRLSHIDTPLAFAIHKEYILKRVDDLIKLEVPVIEKLHEDYLRKVNLANF